MTEDVILEKLQAALEVLYREDYQLFESGVREEALSHRLAGQLQRQFNGWAVDAEYDKIHVDGIPAAKKYISSTGKKRSAIPDVIVHQRQTSENLVAIEIKKLENRRGRDADYDKLRAYLQPPYSYVHAVFLEMGLPDGHPYWKIEFRHLNHAQ